MLALPRGSSRSNRIGAGLHGLAVPQPVAGSRFWRDIAVSARQLQTNSRVVALVGGLRGSVTSTQLRGGVALFDPAKFRCPNL